ncbi:GNAT family N-acetyltransferase [Devosia neptuniae]|jgi:ribosomal protein S18 acetylase RimI-like enzyme|uniref:GNAT family N-acetyltransferase n=1 Tax=Devosia TaxID=46913 RepID=UPI0022AF18F0|nr:GNAT family N-acetyltransferase [Devosia neptuniae]MCZ4347548.1 GNAT family N-acetyltransferase [Devosia neptuniae]|tara:strand:- start:45044 stop:45793 length:750 start_codon:yes stop_codon:yes gene_type:complete
MTLPSAAVFEQAGLKAWPGIEVEWDGAWVRRATNGYTKRANSVQSLDIADDANAPARLAAAIDWFGARGLPPVFRITPLAGPGMIAALDAQGWGSLDASYQYAMTLAPGAPEPGGQTYDVFDPDYLAIHQRLAGYSEARQAGLKGLLAVLTVPARGIVLRNDAGVPVASGLMAIADDIVVTGNVVTDPGQRRKGHAAAMMRTGHAWAYGAGARIAALNVQADNVGAQALYQGLGYAYQYDYHYRVPGGL